MEGEATWTNRAYSEPLKAMRGLLGTTQGAIRPCEGAQAPLDGEHWALAHTRAQGWPR